MILLHFYITSASINNDFNHKIQSNTIQSINPSNKNILKIFFFVDSFSNRTDFLSDKSTYSSYAIFLFCKVCNYSFGQRSKIISKHFFCIQYFGKTIFCHRITKVLQFNHSQKVVLIVERKLI